MKLSTPPVVMLSGAGGGSPNSEPFRAGFDVGTTFEVISYPSWRRYLENAPCFDTLIDDLSGQIRDRVPEGPIQIIGISIGGHLGYVIATKLQEYGRDISSFCAVDAFAVHSTAASAGWFGRAMCLCAGLLAKRKFAELALVIRSRFWRAVLRLCRTRLINVIRILEAYGLTDSLLKADPLLEGELNMRLLIQLTAPSLAQIDREPKILRTSAILLRTALTIDSDDSWRRRCPEIRIYEIPGDHLTMLEAQNISAISSVFSAAMRESHLVGDLSHVQRVEESPTLAAP